MTITRRTFLTFAGVATTAATLPRATSTRWERLGAHPGATAQPTAAGRQIADLEIYRGMLFAGYGDWNGNTGPISIDPFDISRGRFIGDRHRAYTHAIHTWRITSAGLMAPNIDPLGDAPVAALDPRGGFSWSPDGLTWKQQPVGASFHVFDITDSDAGRFAVGSGSFGGQAGPMAWRRTAAYTWERSFARDGVPAQSQDRYHWIAAADGVAYLQAGWSGGGFGPMRRFHQGYWQEMPLVRERFHLGTVGSRVQSCDGRLLSGGSTGLRVFTPSTRRIHTVGMPGGAAIIDLYVSGRTVYVLTRDRVFVSRNAGETFAGWISPVSGATSLAVGGGRIYLGTSSGVLYAHDL